ncbi:MAG: response regulator [Anaerolineae bacterium]|nr:response regulator [Anaerolineae bacterium]
MEPVKPDTKVSAEKPGPVTPAAKPEGAGVLPSGAKPAALPATAQAGTPALSPTAQATPAGPAPAASVRKPVIDPARAHVLVVEDNVPNFVLIARMLAYMGIQRCEWKTSGWQVVEFADTLPHIDLILMDIRLPYEDGFQALEKVRASSRLKDTLVVAVTAEASAEQMKRAREAGFNGFLGKPLDPDRFPDQIRRILNGEPVWELH